MSLVASGIAVRAGRRMLLDNVTACVEPGQVLAVLGANGAGKSTLLRALAGDVVPVAGGVMLDGADLTRWPLQERARRRAVLPQHSTPAFALTALELVQLGRTPWPEPQRHKEAVARAALSAAGALAFEHRLFDTLSGGEAQRVHLARVLAQLWEPATEGAGRYLLLDEPTSSLDLEHQQGVLTLVRGLSRQGFGVLTILHDPNLALAYADQVVILSGGRVMAAGEVTILANPALLHATFGLKVSIIAHPVSGKPWIVPNHSN